MTAIWEDIETGTAVHGLANDDELALLAWDDEHKTDAPRPEIVNRRYVLPDPTTGDAAKWTRVTTFCEAIDDGSGLTIWKLGLTVRGLVHNDALYTQAKAEHDNDKALRAIAEEAHLFAGSKLSAAVGTALHTATEHYDLGTGHRPPDPWGAHVDAWAAALAEHGIEILPAWIERTVVLPTLGVVGTLDRLVRLPDGRIVVLDVKTGKDVRKANYAVQAAVYANATHAWTPDGYEPMPDVDKTTALIAHLSAIDGTCSIVSVDIAKGWEKAQVCALVREARSVAGIFTKAKPAEKVAPAPDRTAWIVERITKLKADYPERVDALRERWPMTTDGDEIASVPRQPPWTPAQIDLIDAALNAVEPDWPANDPERVAAAEEAKTPAPEPEPETPPTLWPVPDNGDMADDGDAVALREAIAGLAPDRLDKMRAWVRGANEQGRPWTESADMSLRGWAIGRAALHAIKAWHDVGHTEARTRAALAYVTGEDLHPTWATGAVLGSLTVDQANELADLVAAYKADKSVKAVIDAITTAA